MHHSNGEDACYKAYYAIGDCLCSNSSKECSYKDAQYKDYNGCVTSVSGTKIEPMELKALV